VRFENKNSFLYFENAVADYSAGGVVAASKVAGLAQSGHPGPGAVSGESLLSAHYFFALRKSFFSRLSGLPDGSF
jgi:hypothetical protein